MSEILVLGRGAAPGILPACPLPGHDRERRPLFVIEKRIHAWTPYGWVLIPRGYVTDFASIPVLASLLTGMDLQALGPWAWAAIIHDMRYAVGEPGKRAEADATFHWRLGVDGVHPVTREVLYRAVRLGGGGGYASAAKWWETANFADPETGAYPVKPPFAREEAFAGRAWGIRPLPDWPAVA